MSENDDLIAPWIRTILILPAYIFIVGIFQAVASLILGIDISDLSLQKNTIQDAILAVFTLIGTIITVGIFRRNIDKESFRSMGFSTEGFWADSLFGLSMGAFIIFSGFVILYINNALNFTINTFNIKYFGAGFSLFMMVSLSEELLLRAYVLNNLMKSVNHKIALLLSSVMFSIIHIFNLNFSWIGFINIFLAGILLGLPYIYNQKLWWPIALHFSWNFFQGTIFGFNVSGHETYSIITQTRTSDTIWNGGKFGFEGSVLSIIFQIIAIVGVWWWYSGKRNKNIAY